MPTLHWIGKEKVVNHNQEVPYKILEHKYGYTEEGQQSQPTNSGNKIIHGDNLEALKSLLPEYEGKIKCIYIDPPYNTGNEKWVYNDNVNHPKIKKWLGDVVGKEGDDLTRHDKWLCMMYPRLKLLHKLLADDGAIFISIDDNEQANLRLICDEIFGKNNFVTNIIWEKNYSPRNDSKFFSSSHDFILVYTKLKTNWNRNYLPRTEKQNKFYFGKDGKGKPQLKRYLSEVNQGIVPQTIWKHEEVSHSQEGKKELNKIISGNVFDSPKPYQLIISILKIATNKNDLILDSFAGSGTTAHAVLNLNKEDGGNRKFIMIEMEDYAEDITAERVRRVIQDYGECKKAVEGTGGQFDYYELGAPIFQKDKNLNEKIGEEKIREYIYYTETKEHLKRQQSEKAEQYIIYADFCLLDKKYMQERNIIFKKIPRDIKRF